MMNENIILYLIWILFVLGISWSLIYWLLGKIFLKTNIYLPKIYFNRIEPIDWNVVLTPRKDGVLTYSTISLVREERVRWKNTTQTNKVIPQTVRLADNIPLVKWQKLEFPFHFDPIANSEKETPIMNSDGSINILNTIGTWLAYLRKRRYSRYIEVYSKMGFWYSSTSTNIRYSIWADDFWDRYGPNI